MRRYSISMGRPKGVKRFPKNLSLSRECINILRDLAKSSGRTESRVVEDMIMANKGSTLRAQSPHGEDPSGGEAELMARVDGVLAHIDKLKEKHGIEY